MKQGTLIIGPFESEVLKGNPLGDPHERNLYIYLPPNFDKNSQTKIPALMCLTGFLGSGPMQFNLDPFGENLKERLDRLISTRQCPPVIVVTPDCFTKLGGNQYINSSATGRYEDYLVQEIVPYINGQYSIQNWGIFGKSSGGYGAIVLGMRHPEVFQALADHSGDFNFELCYIPDFSETLNAFKEAGGPKKWLEKFWSDINRRRKHHIKPLSTLAMAAHYSPNLESPHLGIDLPFDLETGKLKPEVWKRWQAWDPVNMVAKYASNLKKLKLIFIDCGSKDEFTLHWGARALVQELRAHGLNPIYEEFDDGHMSIAYRYDVSIPKLVTALNS